MLCRWGYMLMSDPVGALGQTRRVLKPGARLALAAWTGPDENLWSALPARELIRRGLEEPPDPGAPGQFAWAVEGVIGERLLEAGFVDFEVAAVDFTIAYASLADWWASSRDMSMRFADATARHGRGHRRRDPAGAAPRPRSPSPTPTARSPLPARTWTAVADGLSGAAAARLQSHVLRRRRGPLAPRRQDRRHPRVRLAGPRPRAEPQGLGRQRRRRPAPRLELGREGQGRRLRGARHRRGRLARRHRDGAAARREARRGLPRVRSPTASPRATRCCSATASRSTTERSTRPPRSTSP